MCQKTACNEDEDCGGDRICGDNGVGTGTACCQPFEGMKILYFMLSMSPQMSYLTAVLLLELLMQ